MKATESFQLYDVIKCRQNMVQYLIIFQKVFNHVSLFSVTSKNIDKINTTFKE